MNAADFILPRWVDLLDEPDPLHDELSALTTRLAAQDEAADRAGIWPEALWSVLAESGAPGWGVPTSFGGDECGRVRMLQRYARVAMGSLTAAFVLSQHDAGVRRLAAGSERQASAANWLRRIAQLRAVATVGISHLTTSRRLGERPMTATPRGGGGYVLNGAMPWVTAACRADVIVTGAPLDDGLQILVAIPAQRPGMTVQPAFPLAALQASCTAEVLCQNVEVGPADLLVGPATDVMAHTNAAGTGGLETSAIALGQARVAIEALAQESPGKTDFVEPVEALAASWLSAWRALIDAAVGAPGAPGSGQVRAQANALALRSTQACLAARKGRGFLLSDPAQRWARQALFFLVWSCPTPVASATIRDLAGLCSP